MISEVIRIHVTIQASRNGRPRMGGSAWLTKNGPMMRARNGTTASQRMPRMDKHSCSCAKNLPASRKFRQAAQTLVTAKQKASLCRRSNRNALWITICGFAKIWRRLNSSPMILDLAFHPGGDCLEDDGERQDDISDQPDLPQVEIVSARHVEIEADPGCPGSGTHHDGVGEIHFEAQESPGQQIGGGRWNNRLEDDLPPIRAAGLEGLDDASIEIFEGFGIGFCQVTDGV